MSNLGRHAPVPYTRSPLVYALPSHNVDCSISFRNLTRSDQN